MSLPPLPRSTRIAAALAALALAASCMLPLAAFAAEAESEADADAQAENDAPALPQIVGSFDKERYEPGEQAVVTLSVANGTPVTWNDVRFEAQLPADVRLADQGGAVARDAETLAPGETLELQLAVLLDSSALKRLAPTGDDGLGGIALACVAAAGFVALAAATFSRSGPRSRKARKGMSVLMSVVLVAGLAPLLPSVAHADEAGEAGASSTSFALEGSAACEQLGIVVPATLTVGSTDQAAGLVRAAVAVADGAAVSANARFARIDLVSDTPFAANLSAENIVLGGDFAGLGVASVERTGDTTASVRIDSPGAPGNRGVVLFKAGSFSNPAATGEATVAVEEARIAFDIRSDSCAYDGAGTFALPVSLENARFAAGATAAQFVFADPSLVASSFAVDPDDDARGVLEVTASAATPLEQFKALAAALDAAYQLVIDPAALVGEAPCAIDHPAYDDGDETTDDTITTAEAAAAVPYGVVKATRTDKNEDGSLTVSNTVAFGALDGTVSIANASQITLPGQENATDIDGGLLENSLVTIGEVRPDGFDFTFTIDAATVSSWYDAYQASGLTPDEADAQFLDEMTLLMRGHEVDLADGAVLNKLGIPQGACSVNLSDETLVEAVEGIALFDAKDDMNTAKEVFEILSKLVSAIGYFCSTNTADIAQGVSQLLGIIAMFLSTGPDYTVKDVLDELQQMKGQLTRMETSVDNLSIQLRAIDKRGGFESDWYEVKWLMDHLNSYGTLYTSTLGSLSEEQLANGGAEVASFADLTPENQAEFTRFAKAVDAKDNLLKTSVYADTTNLGSLILGTGTKNVVQDYHNWIETYYNWDPETFEIKDVYLGMMITSYLYGYTSSMAYLSTMEGTGTPEEQLAATLSKQELEQQADQVIKKLAGTVQLDPATNSPVIAEKSALRTATEPLGTTQVRCLVNDRVYDESSSLTGLLQRNLYEGCRFSKSYERDDVHLYSFNGSLNLAQWQQMAANLPQVRGVKGYEEVKTVYDELVKLGIHLDYPSAVSTVGDDTRGIKNAYEVWHYDNVSPTKVVVSDASYAKTTDQPSVRHVRTVTVDVFDVKTNQVSRGVTAGRHEGVYWVGRGWGYLNDLYPWRVS